MKTVSKKLLSLLLIALLLVSAVPFSAFAVAHDSTHTMTIGYNASAHWNQCGQSDCERYGIPEAAEAHTGDPCSVCGYSVPTVPHTSAHTVSVWTITATGHSRTCQTVGCDEYGNTVDANGHSYADGVCTVCGYVHPDSDHNVVSVGGKAPTCYQDGIEAKTECSICHKTITAGGAVINAKGDHSYGTDGKCTTPGCPAFQAGTTSYTLTLYTLEDVDGNAVNDATVSGMQSMATYVLENAIITVLPDPVRPGYTFAGWFNSDTGAQIYLGQSYTFGADVVAVPKWVEQTYSLTVRRTLNGDLNTAKTIYTVNVPAGTSVLKFLEANATAYVNAELAGNPGYAWTDGVWRDFSGMMPITSQLDVMNRAYTIYVNFTSTGHTLYFNANGGTVTPTSKGVTYGQPVGTLPVPVKSGSVFQGWKDGAGKIYDANTIYNVAGDTSLTAVWNDEALVLLRIYLNGNVTTVNRIVSLDGYVVNNNISRAAVSGVVAQYYAPIAGYGLQVDGLFDDSSWASYCANVYMGGVDNIAVSTGHVTNIYVMVRNANATNGTTSYTGGTTYTTGGVYTIGTGTYTYTYNYGNGTYTINGITYYGTNPKTGDASMIELAMAVMVMSASALAVVYYMNSRKKRAF